MCAHLRDRWMQMMFTRFVGTGDPRETRHPAKGIARTVILDVL